MSDATMTAIRVREEHREKAIVLLSAPIFGKDKPIGPQVTAIATALAEREAAVWEKARKEAFAEEAAAVWEKASEWHEWAQSSQEETNARYRDRKWIPSEAMMLRVTHHRESASHFRAIAAQIRGKE